MTIQQMEKMTDEERQAFMEKHKQFDETLNLEGYTTCIKDYILLWRRFEEGRKVYTQESVERLVSWQPVQIKRFFEEKTPVEDAAIDVDYCCG